MHLACAQSTELSDTWETVIPGELLITKTDKAGSVNSIKSHILGQGLITIVFII